MGSYVVTGRLELQEAHCAQDRSTFITGLTIRATHSDLVLRIHVRCCEQRALAASLIIWYLHETKSDLVETS